MNEVCADCPYPPAMMPVCRVKPSRTEAGEPCPFALAAWRRWKIARLKAEVKERLRARELRLKTEKKLIERQRE